MRNQRFIHPALRHAIVLVCTLVGFTTLNRSAVAQFGFGIPSLPRPSIQGIGRQVIQQRAQQAFMRGAANNMAQQRARPIAQPDWVQPVVQPPKNTNQSTTRHALVIATRDYSNSTTLPSLPGTNRDADLIRRALVKGGYPDENVVLIYDDAENALRRPTDENIRREIRQFYQSANSGVAMIFLIGHGISDNSGSYYCAQNVNESSLDNPSIDSSGLISIDQIAKEFSSKCQAENKLIVVDACRSEDEAQYRGLVENLSSLEDPAKDVWLLSSCSHGQRSWISNDIEAGQTHAVFTYFFAEGLGGKADLLGDNDGEVGLFELFTYAFVKTKDTVNAFEPENGKRIKQNPELFGFALPFELATVDRLVAQRTLTTADVQAERARSADQIADDMLANLRLAETTYRARVSKIELESEFEPISRSHHSYLCYLLGNRIEAALAINPDCKLAHIARGITYRAAGMYEDALDGFSKGDEEFELFVKASDKSVARHLAADNTGKTILDKNSKVILSTESTDEVWKSGWVLANTQPAGEESFRIPREAKIAIDEVQRVDDQLWLRLTKVNGTKVAPLWVQSTDVYWLPEEVDVYTPGTPMRTFGSGAYSTANRIDHASQQLDQMALGLDQLGAPLDQVARTLDQVRMPLAQAANAVRQPTRAVNNRIAAANGLLGRFGVGIPYVSNPVANMLDTAHYYAGYPSYYAGYAASRARIPAGMVRTASGYVQVPNQYVRSAQGWSGIAMTVQAGHHQEIQHEEKRVKLKKEGKLEPVEARPIQLVSLPWDNREEESTNRSRAEK